MDYVTLGRTGLRVSVLGLGGGGHSRLGQQTGATPDQSAAIVRRALELGVNLIDTAEGYGTEGVVGAGLHGAHRQAVIVSTKTFPQKDGRLKSGADLIQAVDANLSRLQTDYIDIYHLHSVKADQYEHVVAELVPALIKLREQGKIRFLGITEGFGDDPQHAMMRRAVHDEYWDVVMVGFNMLNQSARERVFVETQKRGIGVLCMFAVRAALSQPDKLRRTLQTLIEQGSIDRDDIDLEDPLGFVREAASSLPDAAYRFCRAEPGIDVVLSGTGNIHHLEQNIESILRPPLPEAMRQRIIQIFERVDSVAGN